MEAGSGEYAKEELSAMSNAVRVGGSEQYMQKYKALLDAQDTYLESVKKLGLDAGYMKTLFERCRQAFEKNDIGEMKSVAKECQAFGKIEDMGSIGSGHAELAASGTRIVQLAYVLSDGFA